MQCHRHTLHSQCSAGRVEKRVVSTPPARWRLLVRAAKRVVSTQPRTGGRGLQMRPGGGVKQRDLSARRRCAVGPHKTALVKVWHALGRAQQREHRRRWEHLSHLRLVAALAKGCGTLSRRMPTPRLVEMIARAPRARMGPGSAGRAAGTAQRTASMSKNSGVSRRRRQPWRAPALRRRLRSSSRPSGSSRQWPEVRRP